MKLIVGLGNPGPRYDGTRHNVGFAVIDYLAAAPGVSSWRSRFQAQVAEAVEGTEQIMLMKPETFMNLSGRAIRPALDFYKLTPDDLLVICDDIALPLGKLRAKAKGSHGGQNGLRNIQEMLGTPDYPRLRIGVGSPGEHMDAADYVLSRFRPAERASIDEAVAKAAQAVLVWARSGLEVCMNGVNGEPNAPRPKKDKKESPEKQERKIDSSVAAPANEKPNNP